MSKDSKLILGGHTSSAPSRTRAPVTVERKRQVSVAKNRKVSKPTRLTKSVVENKLEADAQTESLSAADAREQQRLQSILAKARSVEPTDAADEPPEYDAEQAEVVEEQAPTLATEPELEPEPETESGPSAAAADSEPAPEAVVSVESPEKAAPAEQPVKKLRRHSFAASLRLQDDEDDDEDEKAATSSLDALGRSQLAEELMKAPNPTLLRRPAEPETEINVTPSNAPEWHRVGDGEEAVEEKAPAGKVIETTQPSVPGRSKLGLSVRPAKPATEEEIAPRRGKLSMPRANTRSEDRRKQSKLTIARALDQSDENFVEQRGRSMAAIKRAREKEQQRTQAHLRAGMKVVRDVTIFDTISIAELANRMAEKLNDVVRKARELGAEITTADSTLDLDTAWLLVGEFGHNPMRGKNVESIEANFLSIDSEEDLKPRPPIITVMGHVDHGKTTLLDSIRKTNVTEGEAGGITQHIGAYQVTMPDGKLLSFIDTPGHAAFSQMRARGSQITDIVVLVVAADDGVQPQTVEALRHAQASGAPIVLAINKIDLPESNPLKVTSELLEYDLVTETHGGDTLQIEISAKQGTNLDKLLEALELQAELLELRANPDRPASGVVLEVAQQRGKGTVATVLVQGGTLKRGNYFAVGEHYGRVRGMSDENGTQLKEAGPSCPLEVIGFDGTPEVGDTLLVTPTEQDARALVTARIEQRKLEERTQAESGNALERMFHSIKQGNATEIPVVLKGDVRGSVEAIASAIREREYPGITVRVLLAEVGGISENDVLLASNAEGIIIGFNVRPNPQARKLAAHSNAHIMQYSLIYELLDDFDAFVKGKLTPIEKETRLGTAEILEVFSIHKFGKVAGCRVEDGLVARGQRVRLIRENVVIHTGNLKQLKRFKDDVRDVRAGQECGMALESYEDMRQGDRIECFSVELVSPM